MRRSKDSKLPARLEKKIFSFFNLNIINLVPWYNYLILKVNKLISVKMGREVLNEAAKAAAVGVTTDELDRIVHEAAIERDCYPSPLNYYEFPKSVCTSVNEVICHGIPDMRPLQNGDLCNGKEVIF